MELSILRNEKKCAFRSTGGCSTTENFENYFEEVFRREYIRPVRERDIPTLARFEQEISRISFGDEAITDLAFHEKKIRGGFEKNPDGMFVLDDGTVCGWLWMDTKTNFLTRETYANFRSFYIDPEHRGGTAATELLARGMAYCKEKGARSVVGKVHADNTAMRALYKQAGFTATHITMEYHYD